MSTILVPVDFSLAAEKALEYALDLMNKEIDKLRILHVYNLPIPDPEMPYELMSKLHDSCKQIAETHTQNLYERLINEQGDILDLEAQTIPGSAVDGILEVSKSIDADLIIMGMRGKNNRFRKILGTTSTRVIRQTDIPVVIVPENADYTPIKKIAYASNLEEEDILALDRVITLANTMNAEVNCIHIQKESKQLDNYKKDLLEEAFRHDLSNSPIHVDTILNDNIVEGLNTYIEQKGIDLIVMLTHHRSIFNRIIEGSRTVDMTFQSKIPVWVFQSDSKSLKAEKKSQ